MLMVKARRARLSGFMLDVAAAFAVLASALLIAEVLHSFFGVTRLAILFLAAVTIAASVRGARAAIVAALMGMLFYKLFLDLRTPETTGIAEDVVNVSVFLVVALIVGTLAGRLHDQAAESRVRAERMEGLFRASRTILDEDEPALWPTLSDTLSQASGGAAFAVDRNGRLRAQSGGSESDAASAVALARMVLGAPATGESQSRWRARLMSSLTAPAGVLVWEADLTDGELEGIITLLGELASAAIVREQTRHEQVRIRAEEEANRLREALLSSISHDFRSPLAAIIGSSTSLLEYGDKFDSAVTRDLLLNIQDEGERLNQFVVNLLNMTKLQSGVIVPAIQPVAAAEVIAKALGRLEWHGNQAVQLEVEGDCNIRADPLLLEQALYNVLDNAVKYGGGAEGLGLRCDVDGKQCEIIVADCGPGLSTEDQDGVFTKFHFAKMGARPAGTGLGLSISRGFVEAMGGTIRARDRSDGRPGLEVAITLPRAC
jgi:two-component system sensor histidine kinase KdpD